jgi:AraC-like DNA-binding protein
LLDHEDFTIRAVACSGRSAHWSAPEFSPGYGIVLVRSGRFRVRHRGIETLAGPTTGYLQGPDLEVEFSHPVGGDVCTAVVLSARLWDAVSRGAPTGIPIPVDGRTELAHLLLLRAARLRDAEFVAAEQLVGLIGRAVDRQRADRITGQRSAPPSSTRVSVTGQARGSARQVGPGAAAARLVAAAGEAIAADEPCASGLLPLARNLGVSPYHLSRTFAAHTRQSVTGYRNRVRVSRALDRLDAGERDLARLAADLGFADQAHLTRTVKDHVGHPPGAVRQLLREGRG